MRVYIAADSHLQHEVRELRDKLVALDIEVTSTWIDQKLEAFHPVTEEVLQKAAEQNFSDIDRAVLLIAYNPKHRHRSGTGGRHVEMGYALARYKRILYVGECLENVFHHAVGVTWVHDLSAHSAPVGEVLAATIKRIWNNSGQRFSNR